MAEGWLQCAIAPGMFSNEVVVQTAQGHAFFVPREFVEGEAGSQGRVRVRVLQADSGAWVLLPSEDLAQVEVQPQHLELIRE